MKKVAVAVVLFIAATSFVQAQSKIAHINVTDLLSAMPEMKAAQGELKKLEETYQKRALELQGFERNIGEAQQAAQQELQQKQAELFEPISKKAKEAIERVAAAQGYDYVVDASPGSGVIVAKGKDILADVKTELGF